MIERKWKGREAREREEGFVDVPPIVKDVPGQIFIPHNELHQEIKEKVVSLLRARKLRGIVSGGTSALVSAKAGFNDKGLLLSSVGPLVAFAVSYKMYAPSVRSRTREVGTASKKFGFLDAAGKYKSEEVRKTHLAYVDLKGNVVLRPRTPEEEELYRKQQTFWKHFISGRARFEP